MLILAHAVPLSPINIAEPIFSLVPALPTLALLVTHATGHQRLLWAPLSVHIAPAKHHTPVTHAHRMACNMDSCGMLMWTCNACGVTNHAQQLQHGGVSPHCGSNHKKLPNMAAKIWGPPSPFSVRRNNLLLLVCFPSTHLKDQACGDVGD